MSGQHTPGPWPITDSGDGKRIIIGRGLVEGPNGYEVAEVYSDDCPREVAEANARLISSAPELLISLVALVDHIDPDSDWDARIVLDARAVIARASGARA